MLKWANDDLSIAEPKGTEVEFWPRRKHSAKRQCEPDLLIDFFADADIKAPTARVLVATPFVASLAILFPIGRRAGFQMVSSSGKIRPQMNDIEGAKIALYSHV